MKRSYGAVATLLAYAVLTTACGNEPVATSSVVKLEICPPDLVAMNACTPTPVANGFSTEVARVCTPVVDDRRPDLSIALQLSSGAWSMPDIPAVPTSRTVLLGAGACMSADFVPTNVPGYVRVDATLGGYTDTKWLLVPPAPLSSLLLTSMPATLVAGQINDVKLQVVGVPANGGNVSAGTNVKVAVTSVTPKDAFYFVDPSSEFDLDSTTGTGTVSITTGPSVTSITIQASATPPSLGGLAVAGTLTSSISLTALSMPDGGN